jgi:two-component system, sensor histidine kinase
MRYFRPLPFHRAREDISGMKSPRTSVGTTRPFVGKLVAVIEDDPLVLEATAGLLRSWGFRVIAAECCDDALRQLVQARQRPDLIVSDYRLPKGATGIDAIDGLRSAFEIPALLISGDSSSPMRNFGPGGYQLLHKPVNAKAFRTALIDACLLQH